MKKALRTAAIAIVIIVVLALITLRAVGLPPKDQRPGLWLTGDLVTTPIGDWSFTNAIPEVQVQTQSWYLLPHSVTTQCVTLDGQLFIASFDFGGPRRLWNRNVERNPQIRIKIGNQLFDRQVVPLTDSGEIARVLQAYVKKYDSWNKMFQSPEPNASKPPAVHYWRLDPV